MANPTETADINRHFWLGDLRHVQQLSRACEQSRSASSSVITAMVIVIVGGFLLSAYRDPTEETIGRILLPPFRRQRHDWDDSEES